MSPAASLSPNTEAASQQPVVALVVRTRRPFFRSKPGRVQLVSTMVVVLAGITALYILATERMKKWFHRTDVWVGKEAVIVRSN